MKKIVIFSCSCVFVLIVFFSVFLILRKSDDSEQLLALNLVEEQNIKESPYTLEELYAFTKEGSWPEDSVGIYENWYDYFSKDTNFLNTHNEYLTYDEYMKVKNNIGISNFFIWIMSIPYEIVGNYNS